ncbi:SCP2 sterol-binding domain-containing protein [Lysobacter sp. H21R4]|uniref:ubiquinone biosynthesis accessory factor UbiJ n=1 Tax=Lysobacter sp. H21R4 TaxID=2781021 RepID=UPI0018877A71|nr:SCP2 sterol-binding domain-containing protein [Lysobacter sp. H21R4]QOY62630.1 SCP2 sterol-binding domain-containing protein [Lysobacter sp. H21R4]
MTQSRSLPPSPLAALKPLAGRALQTALNRALALDPQTRDSLAALHGRRVALHLSSPPLALQIRVVGDGLEVGPVDAAEASHLSISSTLSGLLGQLPFLRNDDAPPVGRLRMEGDADLARRLQRLAEGFDPDWQQPFARVFGDVVGVQVANALAAGLKQARVVAGELAGSAAEYVTEESRDVVPRAELEAFHDDVDAIRDDVERLVARVGRLHSGVAAPGSAS